MKLQQSCMIHGCSLEYAWGHVSEQDTLHSQLKSHVTPEGIEI